MSDFNNFIRHISEIRWLKMMLLLYSIPHLICVSILPRENKNIYYSRQKRVFFDHMIERRA